MKTLLRECGQLRVPEWRIVKTTVSVALSVWAVKSTRVAHCEDVALSVWADMGARVAHCEDVALSVWAVKCDRVAHCED